MEKARHPNNSENSQPAAHTVYNHCPHTFLSCSAATDVVERDLGSRLLSARHDEFEHLGDRLGLASLAVLASVFLLDRLARAGAFAARLL